MKPNISRQRLRSTVLGLGLSLSAFFACGGDKEGADKSGDTGDSSDGGLNIDSGLGGLGFGGQSACGGEEIKADPKPSHILLVIDRSGSMKDKPSGFSSSKWDTMVGSLKTALGEIDGTVGLGLKLYPDDEDTDAICGVAPGLSVALGQDSLSGIYDALEPAPKTGAQTPSAAALAEALEYFTAGDGKDLEGGRFVLLATDGGPNCNDSVSSCVGDGCNPFASECTEEAATCTLNLENRCGDVDCPSGSVCTEPTQCLDSSATTAQVTALAAAGIRTIVLGMPGTEAYTDVLDSLAEEGGLPASSSSPKYHKVTDAEGLTSTLRRITSTLIRSCEVVLKETPPDLGKVNVYLDGEVVPKVDTDGWKFDEATRPPGIVLTGSICEQVESFGVAQIEVRYGCPTVIAR